MGKLLTHTETNRDCADISFDSPIAFHPTSVLFETPNHAALIEKVGVRDMINGVIDEMLKLAIANGCKFDHDFKNKLIEDMMKPNQPESIMWQDFVARRPMEIETYLGSPIKLASEVGVELPRIQTLYTILHNLNIANRNKPKPGEGPINMPPSSPTISQPPRLPSQNGHRPMMNGMPPNGPGMAPRQPRPRNSSNFGPPGMRRGPPSMNGGPPNGYGRPPPPPMNGGSRAPSRRGSMDGNDLEEFSHLVMYDDIPEGQAANPDMALRERELQLRQRELALKEQEMRMRRGPPGPTGPPGPRRGPHPMRNSTQVFDDDDDDDDFFDPGMAVGGPTIDPDNFDMMSVTSRKNRSKATPAASQLRRNPEFEGGAPPPRGGRFRPSFGRNNRTSQIQQSMPMVMDNILDDPLMSYTSNRYGAVDRGAMNAGSRANSLTASRLDELQYGGGMGGPPSMNGAYPRRTSQSPGNPYSPSMRGSGRPSPPNGFGGPQMNGGPSPPNGVRQPVPRYPPGQGNAVGPQQVEQQIGVSTLHQPKTRNVRSLTGSASASAASGEFDSEPSAHSSQTSLPPRGSSVGVQ
mgnify:CR=1 FL=1